MTTDKNTLKQWFRKGVKPLESHFAAWIDSYWHKDEPIPTSSIEGLENTLNQKAENAETQTIRQNLDNAQQQIDGILDGTTTVPNAEYTTHLGTADNNYTQTTLDRILAKHINNVDYDPETATFTFTFQNGTTLEIDTPIENTIKDAHFVPDTHELILTLVSDQEIRVPFNSLLEETDKKINAHDQAANTHADIRDKIETILNGSVTTGNALYAQRLGNTADSIGKIELDAKLNGLIQNVTYDAQTATFTFTYPNGQKIIVDTPLESTVSSGRYDAEANELVLVLISGDEVRIPAAGLNKIYSGEQTSTISTTVTSDGKIQANLRDGSITSAQLSENILSAINSQLGKYDNTTENTVTFQEQARENILSGEKHSVLFGKISKWFSDLKALAFKDKVAKSDLDTNLQNELNGKLDNTTFQTALNDKADKTQVVPTLNNYKFYYGLDDGGAYLELAKISPFETAGQIRINKNGTYNFTGLGDLQTLLAAKLNNSDIATWAKQPNKPSYGLMELEPYRLGSMDGLYRKELISSIKNAQGYLQRICIGTDRSDSGWGKGVLSIGTDDAGTSFCDYKFDIAGRITSPAGTFALTKEIPSSLPANGGNADTIDGFHASNLAKSGGVIDFGSNTAEITTAQFVEYIKALGALNGSWSARGSWSYAGNQIITDTGIGNIHLAGCVVEAFGSAINYTIRITTPSTASSGETQRVFIYINNGSGYAPGWFKLARSGEAAPANGGNADTVDGLHASQIGQVEPGKIATYDSAGYLNARIFHDNWIAEDNIPVGQICFKISEADGYHRFCSVDRLRGVLNSGDQNATGNITLDTSNGSYVTFKRNGAGKGYVGLGFAASSDLLLYNQIGNNYLKLADNGKNYSNNKEIATIDQIPAHFDNLYVRKTGGAFTGYVDFPAGAGNSGSDMRFKTDVTPLENILDDLLDLQTIAYTWTKQGETPRHTLGISASQLLEKGGIFGKIVHERDDDDKTQWVEYDRIGVLALKGLQEIAHELREQSQKQQQQIDAQQQEIDSLKQQIAEITKHLQSWNNPS